MDLTGDPAAATRALESVYLDDGGDLPEAYSRGLYESQFLGWRPEARRFIILFGDAPAHDPDFYGQSLGVDPGRDAIPGTADDLRLKEVIDSLAHKNIAVIVVYDTTRGPKNKTMLDLAIYGFEYMAHRTRGIAVPIQAASEVPRAIQVGLRHAYQSPPGVFAPPAYRTWVDIAAPQTRSDRSRRYAVPVMLHPPADTRNGIYRFPLRVVHDGSPSGREIGRTWVTIRIGITNYPWRWPLLLAYLPLVAFLFMSKLVRRARSAVRYERNGQLWALLGHLCLLAGIGAGAYLLWIHAPGNLLALPAE